MALPSINGVFWTRINGRKRIVDVDTVQRGGRALTVQKHMHSLYRQYVCRTDGNDGDVRNLSGSGRFWDDPEEGPPTAMTDWMSTDFEISYDIDTGMVEVVVASVKMPSDWEGSKVIESKALE